MEIQPFFSRTLDPDNMPLERMAASTTLTEDQKVAGVSRHFEAIMLRQFLTEAYKPVLNPKGEENNSVNDIYKDMMVEHLADSISKSGKFGLAKSFQTQIVHPKKAAADSDPTPAPIE